MTTFTLLEDVFFFAVFFLFLMFLQGRHGTGEIHDEELIPHGSYVKCNWVRALYYSVSRNTALDVATGCVFHRSAYVIGDVSRCHCNWMCFVASN